MSTHVPIQRFVLESKNDKNKNTENNLNNLNQTKAAKDEVDEVNDDKPKKSPTLSEVKKSLHNVTQNEKDGNETNQEAYTFWQFILYLIFLPWTLTKKIFTWILDSMRFDFCEKMDPRVTILIFTGICCLGFVLDVVRQHMHPEKFNDNNLLNL